MTERDRREWNLDEADPCDKDVWRSSVRSDLWQLASYLEGREPTDVDDAPAPASCILIPIMMMMMMIMMMMMMMIK